jgi:hypothetical protein
MADLRPVALDRRHDPRDQPPAVRVRHRAARAGSIDWTMFYRVPLRH